MKKKRLLSRSYGFTKEQIKRGLSFSVRLIFQKKSFPFFGIPSGISFSREKVVNFFHSERPNFELPKSIEKDIFWAFKRRVLLSRGSLMTLEKGVATALGGNLTSKFKLTTTFLPSIKAKSVSRHNLFYFSAKRFFPRILETKRPVAALTHGWQNAFYHWMFEVLPLLCLVGENTFVYMPMETSFQREGLALMGVNPDHIINTLDYDAVKTSTLLVPSFPVGPTKWSTTYLRDKLLPKLKRNSKKRRLYISREDATKRRILNETEILEILSKYGFEKVTLSSLSLKEQMELFYNAEAIIGPHGAGFSHLVFCDPNTEFLEIFSPDYVNICYWVLANCVSLSYCYLFGKGKRHPKGYRFPTDPDIEVDLKEFEASLKLMKCAS